MMEVLEFIFRSFWTWLGCVIMLCIVCESIAGIFNFGLGKKIIKIIKKETEE